MRSAKKDSIVAVVALKLSMVLFIVLGVWSQDWMTVINLTIFSGLVVSLPTALCADSDRCKKKWSIASAILLFSGIFLNILFGFPTSAESWGFGFLAFVCLMLVVVSVARLAYLLKGFVYHRWLITRKGVA